MNPHRRAHSVALAAIALATLFASSTAVAQSCQTSTDLDDSTRAAITSVGQRYFDLAAKGDAASLRQSATPALAADFSSIESTIKEHQADLAGAQTTAKVFLLGVEGTTPLPHAEFLCGVFGKNGQTASSAAFYLDNLAPAKYAVVILAATTPKSRTNFSEILQQTGTDWKLGGLYIRSAQIAGHDSEWFAARAREYKAKGQLHNAWLYALEARSLAAPLSFMSTQATDQLDAESQTSQPADVPANGKTADLPSGPTPGGHYTLTAIFPAAVGNDLDLIVKYQSADVSNTNLAYASNVAVIKALVAKYPELKDAFDGVVARATDPSGRDYGTLLAMKDIK
jgi:DNA polymerase III epsilon subunit-like protein